METIKVVPSILNPISPAITEQDYTYWDGWPQETPQEEYPKRDGFKSTLLIPYSIKTPYLNNN